MTERAQFTTPSAARWLVTAAIALLVLAIVLEKALSAPALATGKVEQVCGLCHVEWWKQLLPIVLLVAVASLLISPVRRVPEEERDDE